MHLVLLDKWNKDFFRCYLNKSQDCTIHTGYRVPGMKKGSLFYLESAIKYRPKLRDVYSKDN